MAILGGAKISTKLGVLTTLLGRVDSLHIGGAMACTFFRAQRVGTGTSLVEEDQVQVARDVLASDRAAAVLRLPVDVVVAAGASDGEAAKVVAWNEIPADRMVVDVGPRTVAAIAADVASAGTVVWNGPLGIYEVAAFARGTQAVARAVGESDAFSVVGGGDLGAAVEDAGVADQIDFISTGGGATLEFLEGRSLPGRGRAPRSPGGGFLSAVVADRPMVAGNWKMNTTVPDGVALARAVAERCGSERAVDVAVLPPFVHLWAVREVLSGGAVLLGAQDVFWEDAGAFTGEVSPLMLAGWCDLVLVGHSERRHLLGETDAGDRPQVRAARRHGLRVIVAVGETEATSGMPAPPSPSSTVSSTPCWPRRGDGLHPDDWVVAYEPVWAIGTGRTATPDQAEEVCLHISDTVAARAGASPRVLYGGSVTADNAAELFARAGIKGGLIGGASLKPEVFAAIVAAAASASTP